MIINCLFIKYAWLIFVLTSCIMQWFMNSALSYSGHYDVEVSEHNTIYIILSQSVLMFLEY